MSQQKLSRFRPHSGYDAAEAGKKTGLQCAGSVECTSISRSGKCVIGVMRCEIIGQMVKMTN